MQETTCGIILCCKGDWQGIDAAKAKVAKYMSKITDYPAEQYSERDLTFILTNAALDFNLSADGSRALCNNIINTIMSFALRRVKTSSLADIIIEAFHILRIRDGNTYVNGFDPLQIASCEAKIGG